MAEMQASTEYTADQIEQMSSEEVLSLFRTSMNGLSVDEVEQRLATYGENALSEHHVSPLKRFFGYFWGPIPWMIEAAAILSFVVHHWMDFAIIMVLLLFNAVIGFWEEHKAENALDALKNALALSARVLRDGTWQECDARKLVPGDIIRIRLGDIIPADVKLLKGDYLTVDQSALTGESLPVNKKLGQGAYSGSVAKQGEMVGVVTATGGNTFFGRTAKLVESAGAVSHFQKAVMRVGDFLIFLAIALSALLVIVQLERGVSWMELAQFVLILVVASIPVAMPAVLSVTMALGALALSKHKAIVSRLQSIEEMAGIDILCSDKTGTLTKNELTLGESVLFNAVSDQELILAGALASKEEDRDAIDLAVISGVKDRSELEKWSEVSFTPFDPVGKRTESTMKGENGEADFSKGAPKVILDLCGMVDKERKRAEDAVEAYAVKGYRTLGVASNTGDGWSFLGLITLFDPPRDDSAETIAQAREHGIDVKMVTGDDTAIGREIAGRLGMSTDIVPAETFFGDNRDVSNLGGDAASAIERAGGFARVFPEHKYGIVKALQDRGHLVAMTGDGVNDAPALKQAEVGIAVSGATDAARAAAALVLTEPGLSVIIKAVEEARRIFERMMSYTIYRIAMTIDIMFFVVLAMLVFDFYPLTAVMIILLALLDDVPIMTIAYDNTWLDQKPVRWDMNRVLSISSLLGLLAVVQTFGLLYIAKEIMRTDVPHIQSMMFLQLVAGGHLMLFITRTRRAFFRAPYPSAALFWAIVGTQVIAVLMTAFGWFMPALSWKMIGIVWAYNLVWMCIQDICKLICYRVVENKVSVKRSFLKRMNQPLSRHPR